MNLVQKIGGIKMNKGKEGEDCAEEKMNKKENKFWKKIGEFFTKDVDEEEEEEEFEKFSKIIENRMNKIPATQRCNTQEGRAQVALMIENAYTQKKISEANKKLGTATWILAIATIALVIGSIYGKETLNATAQISIYILGLIIILTLGIYVIKVIIKFLIKFFKIKK